MYKRQPYYSQSNPNLTLTILDVQNMFPGAQPTIRFAISAVSYTHLRAHETVLDLVCRLLLEKKKIHNMIYYTHVTDTPHTAHNAATLESNNTTNT